MLQISIIGAIGADAVIRNSNGRDFVSFNVATNERFTKSDGTSVDRTIWVSCTIPGNGGNLLPYLKKGATIFASGKGSTRVYSSPKERAMVAGIDLRIDLLELVGGKPDTVPSLLADDCGFTHVVRKCYHIEDYAAETIKTKKGSLTRLYGGHGGSFLMDYRGFVVPETTSQPQEEETTTSNQ